MKRLLAVALVLIATRTFAQYTRTPAIQKKLDSLYQIINTTQSDTVKCITYYDIAGLSLNKLDSALFYLNKGLRLAQLKNYLYGIGRGKLILGDHFMLIGNYPGSLKNLLEAAAIFENLKSPKDLSACYFSVASLYDDLKQEQKALYYSKAIATIARQNGYYEMLATAYGVTAYYYTTLKLYNDALNYCHLVEETMQKRHIKNYQLSSGLYAINGTAYMGLDEYDLGLVYLRKGAALAEKDNNNSSRYFNYLPMATYYEKIGRVDSARFYGEKSLKAAIGQHYDAQILLTTETLARLNVNYDKSKAIELYQQAISINKRIFDTEKTRQVENLTINEQQRQQDLIIERQKAEEERKDNLQLAGIALFIPLFLILALALSRTKVSHKVIEFMSVLGLLLLFEFVTLLIHPFAEKITHHTPVFVYLILVVLAAGLVPLHHTLTHWLTQKLALVHNRHLKEKAVKVPANTGKNA